VPTADQIAWQDLEIGMFVHIAPNTWQDKEDDDLSTPLSAINPDIDTENWAECAVNLGARYIVFVAKHEGGFCMWQTETTSTALRRHRGREAGATCWPICPRRARSADFDWACIFLRATNLPARGWAGSAKMPPRSRLTTPSIASN